MKKGFLLLFTFVAALICTAVHADPVDYSDGIVSFQYDDSYKGIITHYHFEYDETIKADCVIETQMKSEEEDTDYNYAIVSITNYGESWAQENFLNENLEDDSIKSVTITSSELPYERTLEWTNGRISYQKYFGNYGDVGVLLSLTTNNEDSEHYALCKMIFDSVEIDDQFFESGLENMKDMPYVIYNNGIYSHKIKPYLEQVVNICDAYLRFEIEDTEAWKRIDSIEETIKTDFSESDYMCDRDVTLLFPDELDFSLGRDNDIIRSKEDLLRAIELVDED